MKRMLTLTAVSVFLLVMSLGTNAWANTKDNPNLDHFQCYKIQDPTKLDPPPVVSLLDQFGFRGEVGVEKKKAKIYCTPVDKNGEGTINLDVTLTCYKIESADVDEDVVVENQFGIQEFTIKKSKTLCVPSSQERLTEEDPS